MMPPACEAGFSHNLGTHSPLAPYPAIILDRMQGAPGRLASLVRPADRGIFADGAGVRD